MKAQLQSPPRIVAPKPVGPQGLRPAREVQVPIGEVLSRFGWSPESWQHELLTNADLDGSGTVSCAELDRYLADPRGIATSAELRGISEAVRSAPGGVRVDAFEGGARALVQHADCNGDGLLTRNEWTQQLVKLGSDASEPQWVPDMKAAVLRNSVAQVTGEPDPLNVGGQSGPRVVHGYDIVEMNEQGHVPEVVAYLASDDDFAAKSVIDGARRELNPGIPDRKRPKFFADPAYGRRTGAPDLRNPGEERPEFDKGHQRPASDSPDDAAFRESFASTNIAPQTPQLNQQVVNIVENALRDLEKATGGKAVILSGALMVDAQGKPDRAPSMVGPEGKEMAVPKYFYKAVLLTLPDGTHQAFGFKFANEKYQLTNAEHWKYKDQIRELNAQVAQARKLQGPEAKKMRNEALAGIAKFYTRPTRDTLCSIEELQRLSGKDFFKDFAPELQGQLERGVKPHLPKLDPEKYPWAAIVFGD